MTYQYRCTKENCRRRVTLKKMIGQYIQKKYKLCPGCGRDSLSYDPTDKRRNSQRVCTCDGYPFPHHKASVPWCRESKSLPDESDFINRYGVR